MSLTNGIKHKAVELGFDLVGVTGAEPLDFEEEDYFNGWLSRGCAGQMGYLHRNFKKRINPGELLAGARSVLCVGLCYKPDLTGAETPGNSPMGRIANYALYEDYHSFIKEHLCKLVEFMKVCSEREGMKFKVCVDSVPLAERSIAARAGLGFISRNHMLINPHLGCEFFLGEIVTDLKLRADRPAGGDCKSCDKCIKACPTGALGTDGGFDARRCISYLTTEYEGMVDRKTAKKIGNRLFGCDECVLVCPYEKRAPVCSNSRLKFFADRRYMDLALIRKWDRARFEHYFANSVIERLGVERFKRNAKICLENAGSG